jgi:DNA mismatch repair protein MutS
MGITNLTPAMRQYLEIKEQHKDCILFFRMGDFYEMFFEDAVTASRVLEITLTSRNKGREDSVPLCGIPYHAAPSYIAKLIGQGFKVAICEQVEDPKLAKGIVKREVVRIITPGLFVDADNLNAKENNFLAAVSCVGHTLGLAFLDISTGEFRLTESVDREFFMAEVGGLDFREMLLEDDKGKSLFKPYFQETEGYRINYLSMDYFDHDASIQRLKEYFPEDHLKHLGIENHPAAASAAGAILRYATEAQKNHLNHINVIEWYEMNGYLVLDDIAKRNLELFSTIADHRKEGSLFYLIDETVTPMGGRRLRWWLNYPLVNPERIRERLTAVYGIKERHLLRGDLRKALARIYDLERLASRVSMGVANGRDLIALKNSLKFLPEIRLLIEVRDSHLLSSIHAGIDEMPDIFSLIEKTVAEDAPLTIREGGIIKEGYDRDLDELIAISRDGKKWIAALEQKERKRT